jgi:copper homeostasis protein
VTVLVEAAVDSLEDALAAVDGGADRLELCANLSVGGTTPDQALIEAVLARIDTPVYAMIRPRGGSFVYTGDELHQMHRDLEDALGLGCAGVVLGVLDDGNRIDAARTRALVEIAGGERVTFHRAFDRTPDIFVAADALMSIGISRVLTSGGAPSAIDGVAVLSALVDHSAGRLEILAGGGVRANNVREIIRRGNVGEVHARCECDAGRIRAIKDAVAS